jgi:transcriptional regulator with XRE-family HTH domain
VPTHLTSFARQLAAVRTRAGLSQYELARRSGVSRQALSCLEMGTREPVWATVQRLALALGVDCRAFTDPDLELPAPQPVRPRGRPAGQAGKGATPRRPARRRKGE